MHVCVFANARMLKCQRTYVTLPTHLCAPPPERGAISLRKEIPFPSKEIDFSSEDVVKSLSSLGFTVKDLTDSYEVVVPTFRATKDVSMDADIIEEIVRLYGYENIKEIPLKLELTGKEDDTVWNMEYDVKRYLATRYSMNEVHSYLWYDTAFLKECHLEKSGVTLLGKTENNLLRDDLSLSLLPIVKNNLKNVSQLGIFEIGTVIVDNENSSITATHNPQYIIFLSFLTYSNTGIVCSAVWMHCSMSAFVPENGPIASIFSVEIAAAKRPASSMLLFFARQYRYPVM